MKKYLMTVMAAVALGGMFTGCTKDADLSGGQNSAEFNIVQNYEKAFITRFGQPAANQTWGFGESVAKTRTAYTNGNMWADQGYRVPPQLKTEQKDIVRQYFQQVTPIGYKDPEWTNYFIQHVYKGGTNTAGSMSTEKYKSANNGEVVGSNHMDHLAAVFPDGTKDHINNYNNAVCSTYGNVKDSEGVTYRDSQNGYHPDEIQLMLNSTTNKFGYFNSDGSLGHTEYTGLVSWETIRDWANKKGLNGDCLADGWNRSFMGFDFEQVVGDDVFAKDNNGNFLYADYSGPATDGRIWDGEKVINTITGYDNNWAPIYAEGYEVLKYNGKPVHYLMADQNQYCGDFEDLGNDDAIIIEVPGYGKCLDMTVINGLLSQNYLPVNNGGKKKWVKVHGGADGYYSDWIVTLTEAKGGTTPPPSDPNIVCRIIVEDLTVGESSDFDFNDVVFDVCKDGTLIIRAIGGELPIYIGAEGANEVHAACRVTLGDTNKGANSHMMMRNTGWASSGVGKNNVAIDYNAALGYINLGGTFNSKEDAKNIGIWVHKNGTNIRLQAPVGKVASMICVGQDYKWCAERQDIDDKYHKDGVKLFHQYVIGDPNYGDDWEHNNAWYQKLDQ